MEWQTCPRCKSSKYRNPSLKLLVNECGHRLCDNCVEQLFVRGSGSCPQCNKPLKRSKFREQFFEDAEMDKEVDVRRRIYNDLNLRQEDFSSLREFNDYLEQVETFIFNIVNGIEVEKTKRDIEAVKEERKKQLQKSRHKKSSDQELLMKIVDEERLNSDDNSRKFFLDKREDETRRAKEREQLLDDLQDSEMSAEAVWESHKRKNSVLDQCTESEDYQMSGLLQRSVIEEPPPVLTDNDLQWFLRDEELDKVEGNMSGPPVASPRSLAEKDYLKATRASSTLELTMGFESVIPARRALLAAFDGLYCKFNRQ
ncbi:hypothetical protein RvY_14259 [Ramazzottius varieornatus]|uniref:CDK-activating kinase assembly factor MAT1 n=1 Tax=Ramazzottius varieornatus TaxID=947166 RepID=A0A1D1VSE0_RAMVA|nr:hypothetical protein RvY_14259 [Ramazzottius varieornatus]